MITITNENQKNLDESLNFGQYNEQSLFPLQRMILEGDGTLTQLVGNIVGEAIIAEKLYESSMLNEVEIGGGSSTEDMHTQRRIITLNGNMSGFCYLYADSIVYHNNLPVNFSRDMINSKITIGRAWEKYKVETYKVLDSWGFERAKEQSKYFSISDEDLLLYRTYLVYSGGKIIFRITEKFPQSWFQSANQIYHTNAPTNHKEIQNEKL